MALRGRSAIAALRTCTACLHPQLALLPRQQIRTAASAKAAKSKQKDGAKQKDAGAQKKKKKGNTAFKEPDLKQATQYSLCDAIRYIRAFEVGRAPKSSKYEVHVKLRTLKNGPIVRNRLRLPHAVDTSLRVCVICPPNSRQAKEAKQAGAVVVGEEDVFDKIKEGKIEFDRCICHADSTAKLAKAGVARILGPRGLMPSLKTGTVVRNVSKTITDMIGGSEYRERLGVVRMAVGQLGFTPAEIRRNIQAFMGSVKNDCALLSDKISKEILEVVLSSTNSPGFSLNGDFRSADSVPEAALSTL